MTVKMRILHTREGDKEMTVLLEEAQRTVESSLIQGWLVAKTYGAGGKLETIQIQKAKEIQDGDELLLTPPIAGG